MPDAVTHLEGIYITVRQTLVASLNRVSSICFDMSSEVMLEVAPQKAANVAANATNHGQITRKEAKEYKV